MKFNNYKKSLFRKPQILKPLVLAMALPGTAFAAVDCTNTDNWKASKVYNNGDQVVEQKHQYQAKWWTTNENPTSTGQWGVWVDKGVCSDSTPKPPTVSFTAPKDNSTVNLDESVSLLVNAADEDGTIESTVFYVNDAIVTSPWIADSTGNKQVKVMVTDNDGLSAEAVVNITVKGINPLPVVTIDSPTSPVSIEQGQALSVIVSASDPAADDHITKVELLIDNAVFDVDTTAPYEFSWPATSVGAHVVTARAFDSQNDNAVSEALQVTVTGNEAPRTAITSPAAQSQFAVGANVNITADASDSDGSVAQVEFFVDGISIGLDNSAPYSYSWVTSGAGQQQLSVVATDDKGAQTTSASVPVVIGDSPVDHEACRPDGLVGDSVYCDVYDSDGRELMGSDHARRVIGYFTSWRTGLNGQPGYIAKDIPWDKITHINYAFAHIDAQNKVSIGDAADPANAATGIEWPGVAGAEMDPAYSFKGHFNQLAKFKKQHPDVKTLISVGGWAETGGYFDGDAGRVASGGFYEMTKTQAAIDTFADSAVEFLRSYHFDGLDIDYEYATSNNGAGNPMDEWIAGPNRGNLWAGYENLMKTLRNKLDAASKLDGKHYMLTIAAPASGWLLRGQEFYQVTKYLDYVNIMSYDLHGAWNNFSGPNSALFDSGLDPELKEVYDAAQYGGIGYLNTDWAYHYFRGSMPAGRINIGLPYYTRGWKDVEGGTNGLWGSSKLADQSQCPPGTGTDIEVNPHANDNTAPCGSGATGIDNIWHDSKSNGEEEPAGFNPMWHIMNLKQGIAGSYREAYGLTPATDPDDTLQGEYVYAFDSATQTASLWNANRKSYLSIEDETVMKRKVDYVVDQGIGGVMFWELAGDYAWHADKGEYFFGDTLTDVAYQGFKAATPYGNKKAEIEMPVRNLDIQVTFGGFKLGDNNYPIAPKMKLLNNSDIEIPGGAVVEFDVATTTPGTIADQSGLGMKVIKDGSNAAGNNVGGLQNVYHRVQFTIPTWKSIPKGGALDGDIKVQLPVSTPSNFTIEINGVKYGFTEEHGNGKSFCDENPDDPSCKDTPPTTDKCADNGVDPATVPAYPNFPQKDWQGNPSHAATGDKMKTATAVYSAKWWTKSVPGGAEWAFVCNI
ncbi:MAG: chitinase C-terminal domain-containing protein [Algicola sp.]|nr:chitinase C-terminal domain-containing protein [Algicola sp.]